MRTNTKFIEKIVTSIAFIYYFILSLFKLTTVPIWQDEAAEYYCAITDYGPIKGVSDFVTMYERGISIQQQPPLYTWILIPWIKIRQDEYWLRLLGVILVFIGVIAIYKIMNKIAGVYLASFSVVIYSSIYILQYYVKEASEYSLLLPIVAWLIYYFLKNNEKPVLKNVIIFTILCVAAVYTHYGAAFVVIPMALQQWFIYYKQKDIKILKIAIISEMIAAIAAGIPLLYYYLIPQTSNPVSTISSDIKIEITGNNIILDFFDSLMWVLRWNISDYNRDGQRFTIFYWFLLAILIVITVFVYVKSNNIHLKRLLVCNCFSYFIYYVVTTLTFYAYGWFGNRYNLFLFNTWFVAIIWTFVELVKVLKASKKVLLQKAGKILRICLIVIGCIYSIYGVKRVNDHWDKMDLRTVIQYWYENDCKDTATIVDVAQRYSFTYYLTQNESFDESLWNNINCLVDASVSLYSTEEMAEYIVDNVYNSQMPESIFVVTGDYQTLMQAFEQLGYQSELVVDSTSNMYYVYKK